MEGDYFTTIIGKQITLQRGFDITKREQQPGEFPVVSSGGISSYHNHSKVVGPGVVLGRKGSIGTVFFLEKEFWPHDTTLWVKDFKGNNPRFVYYFFQNMAKELKRMDVGAANPSLNRNHIHPLAVTWAHKDTQQSIAHILGSLDDKIELNRQMNATLEAIAQALFKSWFVDFDPVIDNALAAGNAIPQPLQARAEVRKAIGDRRKPLPGAIQDQFPSSFVFNDDLGWIPEGWDIFILNEVTSELRRGISPKYLEEGGVRVINQKCIRNHSINYSLTRRNDPEKRKINGREIEIGDVLVNSTGVGTLGRMAQVKELSETTVVDSHVTVLRPSTTHFKPFLFGQTMLGMETIIEAMGEGSTGQTELSRTNLQALKTLIPPIVCQDFMEKELATLAQRQVALISESETLEIIRDTLLPKLLSGQLRIPQAKQQVSEALCKNSMKSN